MPSGRIVHVIVQGRVQGVGFRAWTHHQAELRGLAGWVRNRRDGTVEAVLSGPAELVEAMLHALREGPAGSRVDRVETEDGDASLLNETAAGRFEVRGTA